jgi:hypothetical protein
MTNFFLILIIAWPITYFLLCGGTCEIHDGLDFMWYLAITGVIAFIVSFVLWSVI